MNITPPLKGYKVKFLRLLTIKYENVFIMYESMFINIYHFTRYVTRYFRDVASQVLFMLIISQLEVDFNKYTKCWDLSGSGAGN